MIKVGFTGTRRGLTLEQKVRLREALKKHYAPGNEFHHGDCVGADDEAAEMAASLGYVVVCHPPIDPKLRAFAPSSLVLEKKPYLDRNYDIVEAADFMIACPSGTRELHRSGTWATIRYARKALVPLSILFPGTLKEPI